jgi:folate-binding protein YgfZ
MAAATDTIVSEHRVLTQACGLLDRSERGRLALTGPEAKAFLQGQVTNDVEGLQPGTGCYAAFLTHKGKMLGDLRILDLGDELLLDTERSALQALFNMIRRFKLGMDVELHKRTLETAMLSLIGPEARRVAGADALGHAEHANADGRLADRPVVLIASDVGIDVLCAAEDLEAVRTALEAAGAQPVAEEAAEVLRVERGRPRWGAELDESVIPQEAGLNDRAVSFTKGCYVGQETVARLHYRGKPNRHLRGLRLSAPVAPGTPLRLGEREVGRIGSSVVSPALGPIALAIVRREAEPGALLSAGDGGATAEVVTLPFAADDAA